MRPAFSSPQQAAAFAALLLGLLLLPVSLGKNLLPPRMQLYDSEGWHWGPYPWDRTQIFDETNDIDIAFVGSSHMAAAINTPYVQQQLDERLGRKTVVRSICWHAADFDILYLVIKDLLEHRKVKMLVFYDETAGDDRNPLLPLWFRWGESADTLAGLPMIEKVPYYFAALLGVPQNLVGLMRPNIPADLTKPNFLETLYNAPNPATVLGAVRRQLGYADLGFRAGKGDRTEFQPYQPRTGMQPSDVCIYSPATQTNFLFLNRTLPDWQLNFARKFAAMVRSHGCKLVLVHLPVLADAKAAQIQEKVFWPDVLQTELTMVGPLPQKFFGGLTDAERKRLYVDPVHFNWNGQQYFTPLITPALFQIYEDVSHP